MTPITPRQSPFDGKSTSDYRRTIEQSLDAYISTMKSDCLNIRDARRRLHCALREAGQASGLSLGQLLRELQLCGHYIDLKDALDPFDLLKEIQWEMFLAMEKIDRAIQAEVLPACATEPVRALMALYPRANAVVGISEGDKENIRPTGTWVETMMEADSRRFVDLRSGETGLIVSDENGKVISGLSLDRRLDEFHAERQPSISPIESKNDG